MTVVLGTGRYYFQVLQKYKLKCLWLEENNNNNNQLMDLQTSPIQMSFLMNYFQALWHSWHICADSNQIPTEYI